MSLQNVGFDFNAPQAADRSYGALSAGRNVPYASIAAATTSIVSAYRFRGKTVLIDLGDGNGANEYWWRVGTGDNQLVPKFNGEQRLDFVIGDGGIYTPADQSVAYPNALQPNPGTLINCIVLGVGGDTGEISPIPRGGYQSFQYNQASGIITLVNTVFSNLSWYFIKYRQL